MRGAAGDGEEPLHARRADHRTEQCAGAADDHHGERFERRVHAAALGREHADVIRQQHAADGRVRAADGEDVRLDPRDIDAEHPRGELVVPHDVQRAQKPAPHQQPEGEQSCNEAGDGHGIPGVAAERDRWHQHQPGGTAGDRGKGTRHAFDDESEAERADRKIDSGQAHENLRHQARDCHGDDDAERNREQARHVVLLQDARGVARQGSEGRLAQREHSGDAEDQVEPDERKRDESGDGGERRGPPGQDAEVG